MILEAQLDLDFPVCLQMPPLPAELPIRLPLLNFRALGSTGKDVYIQQW